MGGLFAGDALPQQRLLLEDVKDFSCVRFMESYESRHSDFDFTSKLAARLGVTRPPLRIDSQAKYGECPPTHMQHDCTQSTVMYNRKAVSKL